MSLRFRMNLISERMFPLSLRRKIIALALTLLMLLPIGTIYGEQQSTWIEVHYPPIHFVVDGKELAPPEGQRGFIYQGSTYVPLRFLAYSLNKAVEWDGESYTVTLQEPTDKDKITIAEYNMNRVVRESRIEKFDASQLVPTWLEVYFEQVTYVFDGQKKQPPEELPGMILEGSVYVPMRFLSESIGKQVTWDPETYTVSAKSASVEPKPEEKPATDKPDGTTPPGGTSSPVGGGGGSPAAQPSYESVKAEADAKIAALRDEAEAYYFGLLKQYKEADAEKQLQLKQAGASQLEVFNSRFDALLGDFESKLENNKYNTDIIYEYRQEYEEQKAIAKILVGAE